MSLKYSEVAPKVLDRKELLTKLISDSSYMMATATRLLELESGIKCSDDPEKFESTVYNITRTLIKRSAKLAEDLRALGLMTDQQTDHRLYRSARVTEVEMLSKLLKWHPDAHEVMNELSHEQGEATPTIIQVTKDDRDRVEEFLEECDQCCTPEVKNMLAAIIKGGDAYVNYDLQAGNPYAEAIREDFDDE